MADESRPWPEVDNRPTFASLEESILERWNQLDVFHKSLEQRADAPLWTFYEGPPTANGRPGTHHVESRTFKDVFPRYRTMKGHRVPRKGGWDCHGLPVELEIEKELGLNSKAEIEEYGIEAFNAKCRESVTRYVDEWERLTERIGFWVDLDDAYWTMDTSYVESLWWALGELWDKGLIFEDHRVTPYCARCGTGLSDAEVAMGYDTVVDPSVFVEFPILDGPLAEENAALVVWTTTPWTLPSNTAVAIGEDVTYVLAAVPHRERPLVLAEDLVERVLGADAEVLRTISADDLVGLHYEAPFTLVEVDEDYRYVTVGDFVTTTDGSGLVHMAPAFGADDMEVGRREGLPVINPVGLDGAFTTGPWEGRFVKDADPAITRALESAGVLIKKADYEHSYPFCWRCKTALIYYAKPSWYIRTTAKRDELLANNATINWRPEHIREGRFGNWLENNVDWALSRDRYWGTPLPFWRCPQGHVTVVRSLADLGERAGEDTAELDPHRPFVDAYTFGCPDCGEEAVRVPDVADTWFDSGGMPYAQWGYPYQGQDAFDEHYPAQFIAEAIDQTRGWFYTLLAESTLLFDNSSYETVLCLGHIVDEDGFKMSKSKGNSLDPWELIDGHGADAIRWLMLAEGNPWVNRRVGHHTVEDVVRRFFLTLWNTHYFFLTYARIDGFALADEAPPVAERGVSDRWVLAELADTVRVVDDSLEAFDVSTACRRLERFTDDLSNWYVRRNRRRFWKAASDDPADKAAAYHTLHTCLSTVASLLAPFVPFLADRLYLDLVASQDPEAPQSVHLLDFPAVEHDWIDDELRDAMATARRVVELGRQARSDSGMKVRQPLARALVTVPADQRTGVARLVDEIADELNVKSVELSDGTRELVDRTLKPNFRALGPAFQKDAPTVASAIGDADEETVERIVGELQSGTARLEVGGEDVELTPEMVEIVETPRTGWELVTAGSTSIALDLEITEDLELEGTAREIVRAINDLRKAQDLELDDRIRLSLDAKQVLLKKLEERGLVTSIAGEVLAESVVHDREGSGQEITVDGTDIWIGIERLG